MSAFVERLAVPADDPQRLAALALIDPVHRGREVIARVGQMSPVGMPGPDQSMAVGRAAMAVWADNLAASVPSRRGGGIPGRRPAGAARPVPRVRGLGRHQLRRGSQRDHRCGRGGKARRGDAPAPLRARREARPCHRCRRAGRGGDGRSSDRRRPRRRFCRWAPTLSSGWSRSRAAGRRSRPSARARRTTTSLRIFDPDGRFLPALRTRLGARRPRGCGRARRRRPRPGSRSPGRVGGDRGGHECAASRGSAGLRGGAPRRRRDRRAAVPGRDDVERRGLAVLRSPCAARVRRVAAPATTGRGFAHTAARGRPGLRRPRPAVLRRARASRAARLRRARAPSRPRGVDRVEPAGAPDRAAGGRGPLEPRDRRAALPLPPDGEHAPVPALPEARHHVAHASSAMRSSRRTPRSASRHPTYATVRTRASFESFSQPEGARMLYSAIVKKRIRQAFDDVNNRRWDELMTSITRVHHRFGGVHAIGGERHDRDDPAPVVRAPGARPAQSPARDQRHLGEGPAVAHDGVRAVGRDRDAAERRRRTSSTRFT